MGNIYVELLGRIPPGAAWEPGTETGVGPMEEDYFPWMFARYFGGSPHDWKDALDSVDRYNQHRKHSIEFLDDYVTNIRDLMDTAKETFGGVLDVKIVANPEPSLRETMDTGLLLIVTELNNCMSQLIEQRVEFQDWDYTAFANDSNGSDWSLRSYGEEGKEDADGSRKRSQMLQDAAARIYDDLTPRVERARVVLGDAIDYLRMLADQASAIMRVSNATYIATTLPLILRVPDAPRLSPLPILKRVFEVLKDEGVVTGEFEEFDAAVKGTGGEIMFHGSWKDAAFVVGGLLAKGFFPAGKKWEETGGRFRVIAPKDRSRVVSGVVLTEEKCKGESWGRRNHGSKLQDKLIKVGLEGKPARGYNWKDGDNGDMILEG